MANKNPKEEDKVAAAYENISKKLENLRNGGDLDEDFDETGKENKKVVDEDDAELAEWKGPKPMENEEDDNDDSGEIRRVNLKNPTHEDNGTDKAKDEDDQEDDDKDDDKEDVKEEDKEPQAPSQHEELKKPEKEWEPVENDPLDKDEDDQEDEDDDKKEEEKDRLEDADEGDTEEKTGPEEKAEKPDEFSRRKEANETKFYENESEMDFTKKKDPQPDTLDDLTEDAGGQASGEPEDDYNIPNLKGSRQEGSNIGYNAFSQSEPFARGYQDNSNMENMQTTPGGSDPNNFFSQHSQSQAPKRANKFHLLILVVIGIAVIGFTVYILKGGFGQISMNSQPSPSPSAQESASPTPTPTPEPARSELKVRVLNGSGKTGLAKTVSDKLSGLGYQVDKTGNATNSAFTQTIVRVKTEKESFIAQLVKDLLPEFDATGNTSLKDTDDVDVEIILGAK